MPQRTIQETVIGPWPKGINNRLPPYALPEGTLEDAVNVDVDQRGFARRRQGYTKIVAGLNTHSGYSCAAGTFYVDGANLTQLNTDNSTTVLYEGLVGAYTVYEYFNGVVYLSDGLITKRIVNGAVTDWPLDATNLGDPEFMAVPPANILKFWHGRMYIVVGKTIWYTDPFMLGSVQKQRNFIQVPATCTIFEPVSNGIWVVADQTYFFAGGGPGEFVIQSQLNYGAIPYTSVLVPNDNDVMWYSARGVVRGTQDGQIKNLQEDNVAADTGTTGAAFIREEKGLRQYIASIADPTLSPMAASSWMEMDVIIPGG